MKCTNCPELTLNKSNWCEECKLQDECNRIAQRADEWRASLKQLMKPTDPNWEDHANLYDGY